MMDITTDNLKSTMSFDNGSRGVHQPPAPRASIELINASKSYGVQNGVSMRGLESVSLNILAGEYVAQALMVPGERVMGVQENPELLKFDLRIYTYDGTAQWTAARMYQGQTTNFRTPGGGFAPVYSLPDAAITSELQAILKPPGDTMSCCLKNCT